MGRHPCATARGPGARVSPSRWSTRSSLEVPARAAQPPRRQKEHCCRRNERSREDDNPPIQRRTERERDERDERASALAPPRENKSEERGRDRSEDGDVGPRQRSRRASGGAEEMSEHEESPEA